MNTKQRFPEMDSHGCLERAFFWLNSNSDIRIFYAALELRFSFEKVFLKHGLASNNVAIDKLNWKPEILNKELSKEFSQRINLNNAYRFYRESKDKTEPEIFGYYLPINQELYSLYGKLHQFLHAQWAIRICLPDRKWQRENSEILNNFAMKLIPHANPSNSLQLLAIPEIKYEEQEISHVEEILREYW